MHGRVILVSCQAPALLTQLLRQVGSFEHTRLYERPWVGQVALEGSMLGHTDTRLVLSYDFFLTLKI